MTSVRRFAVSLLIGFAAVAVAASGCNHPAPAEQPAAPSAAPGAVAAPDTYSADAAEAVLREGGNAVDAAVVTAFTLAVTQPEAGNIGGGGFMLIYQEGRPYFLDYRESAPAAATRDMYLGPDGEVVPDLSVFHHLASGVPGTVRGLWEAHQRFGSLPWKRLVDPAVALARTGFVVHEQLATGMAEAVEEIGGRTNFADHFGGVAAGQTFQQPELAAVLSRIAEEGPDGFYAGETADLIVAEMERGGGIITRDDLAGYEPRWRDPIVADWRDFTVITAPPPSSGGIALLQLLQMKEALGPAFEGQPHNSPEYIHLVAEIEKRVFADRAEYLGDPDFVEVPVARLISRDYSRQRAAGIAPGRLSPTPSIVPGLSESTDTTHFSIVDAGGNAVANTYTLNWSFGSGVVVEGGGFLLNNEMDDFSAKPGVPNIYGVVGKEANAIQPGKRMLSSMTPTILLADGRAAMVLGTPGGPTIFTSVFQVLANVFDLGMSLESAVAAPRFHHQLLPPDEILYEPGRPLPQPVLDRLAAMGYKPKQNGWDFGDIQAIRVNGPSGTEAVADPRGRGEGRVVSSAGR